MSRHLIVIDKAGADDQTDVPDLRRAAATDAARDEAEANMVEAIRLQFAGLREDGVPLPLPEAYAEVVAVA